MLETFSKHYSDIIKPCKRFVETINDIQFSEDQESYRIFLLTMIKLNINNAESIGLLLNNDQISSTLMICRNIIESFFNIDWAFEQDDDEEIKERFYKWEGDYLYYIDKQVNLIINDQLSPESGWDKRTVELLKNSIDMEKTNNPHLLTTTNKGKTIFKHLPSFAERMTEKRLKYYQFYIFTSLFAHPSPKLKDFYFSKTNQHNISIKNIDTALKQTLALCVYLIESIMGYAEILFKNTNSNFNIRKECYEKIKEIVRNATQGIVNFDVPID